MKVRRKGQDALYEAMLVADNLCVTNERLVIRIILSEDTYLLLTLPDAAVNFEVVWATPEERGALRL